MATEQSTGRKMDEAWRRAISEGKKRGGAAVDTVSSAASSVKGGLVEKATALKNEISAKAPGVISSARSNLKSGLENAKASGAKMGEAVKVKATNAKASVMERFKGKSSAIDATDSSKRKSAISRVHEATAKAGIAERAAKEAAPKTKLTPAEKMRKRTMGQ